MSLTFTHLCKPASLRCWLQLNFQGLLGEINQLDSKRGNNQNGSTTTLDNRAMSRKKKCTESRNGPKTCPQWSDCHFCALKNSQHLFFCLSVADGRRPFHKWAALAGSGKRLFTDDVRISTQDEAVIDVAACCVLRHSTTLTKKRPPQRPAHTFACRVVTHVGESVRVVWNMFLCCVPGFH